MKSRWMLALAPLAAALGVAIVVGGAEGLRERVVLAANLVGLLLATVGCAVAAASFDRGDYLWNAWALNALSNGVLLADTLLFGVSSHAAPRVLSSGQALVSGGLSAVANLTALLTVILVGRAWRVAGLDLQVSNRARNLAFAASAVLALAIAAPAAWGDLRELLGGHPDALSGLISDIGDIATLAVLAPVLLTALALRGGTLAWPWGLLAVSTLGWLGFDAISALGFAGSHAQVAEESFRMLACVANLSAGLLQWLAVRPAVAPATLSP